MSGVTSIISCYIKDAGLLNQSTLSLSSPELASTYTSLHYYWQLILQFVFICNSVGTLGFSKSWQSTHYFPKSTRNECNHAVPANHLWTIMSLWGHSDLAAYIDRKPFKRHEKLESFQLKGDSLSKVVTTI